MNIYEKLATFNVIETPRMLLRPMSMMDAEDMFDYASKPENVVYVFPAHHNLSETRLIIATLFMKEPLGKWVIELKSESVMIGTVSFVKIDEKARTAEIGYILNQKYWGQGLMTEVVRTLAEISLTEFALCHLDIVVDSENIGSCKVAEKSGFILEENYKGLNSYTKIVRNFKRYRKVHQVKYE